MKTARNNNEMHSPTIISHQVISGPLPPASEMEKYERIKAGTMDKVLEFIFKEHDTEFQIANKQLDMKKDNIDKSLKNFIHVFHVMIFLIILFFISGIIMTLLGYELIGVISCLPSFALSLKYVSNVKNHQ